MSRQLSIRARVALVVALTLFSIDVAPQATPAPAKGTQILWDATASRTSLRPIIQACFVYGYAQMAAHSELLVRLYAQARGRGAEFYGDASLDGDRWVRTDGIPQKAKQWAMQQSPEFGPKPTTTRCT